MDYKNLEMLAWLVGQFRKAGNVGITYDELIDRLYNEPAMNKNLTKRTFHNYLKELRNRFDFKIECDKRRQIEVFRKGGLSEENRRYRYHLVEEPQSDNAPWTMPFLVAFETSAAMKQLHDSEEDRKYIYIDNEPTGVENMNILLDAIRQQKCVDLYYHPKNRYPYLQENFEPRGLVQKNYVWYVLGYIYHMEKIWPLNMLTGITIKDIQYRPNPNFNSERFWVANKKLWREFSI